MPFKIGRRICICRGAARLVLRIDGSLRRIKADPLSGDAIRAMLSTLLEGLRHHNRKPLKRRKVIHSE